jgi:hypothetical protein
MIGEIHCKEVNHLFSYDELWGTDIPGSTRRLEGLAKDSRPIIPQGHPFVGQGRNH